MSDCKCCDTTEHCCNGCYHRMLFVNHYTTYIFICTLTVGLLIKITAATVASTHINNTRIINALPFFLCSLLSLLCPFILLLIPLFKPNFSYSYYTPCFCKLQDIIKFFLFFLFLTKLFLQTIAVFIALC